MESLSRALSSPCLKRFANGFAYRFRPDRPDAASDYALRLAVSAAPGPASKAASPKMAPSRSGRRPQALHADPHQPAHRSHRRTPLAPMVRPESRRRLSERANHVQPESPNPLARQRGNGGNARMEKPQADKRGKIGRKSLEGKPADRRRGKEPARVPLAVSRGRDVRGSARQRQRRTV